VLDLRINSQKVLVRGGIHGHYVPSGHLVYARAGTLLAVRYDVERQVIVGSPVPVLDGIMTTPQGAAQFSVSAGGTLVYVPGGAQVGPRHRLVWVDRQNREAVIGAPVRGYVYPRISPDGTRLALDVRDEEQDI
jgi:serine/threonine-protein kinase